MKHFQKYNRSYNLTKWCKCKWKDMLGVCMLFDAPCLYLRTNEDATKCDKFEWDNLEE